MKTYQFQIHDDLSEELGQALLTDLYVSGWDEAVMLRIEGIRQVGEPLTPEERKTTMVALRQYRDQLTKARRELISLTGGPLAAVEALDERIAIAESAREKVDHG